MRLLAVVAVLAIGAAVTAWATLATWEAENPASAGHQVDWYLRTAAELQALGRERACERLRSMASDRNQGDKVIVLCRMLFTSTPGTEFRRPSSGAALFLGETTYQDWPLEPIELVDDIPFRIVRGYMILGVTEHPQSYVDYCIAECAWSAVRFRPKSTAEKRQALQKLLSSAKWQQPLDSWNQDFLAAQIK